MTMEPMYTSLSAAMKKNTVSRAAVLAALADKTKFRRITQDLWAVVDPSKTTDIQIDWTAPGSDVSRILHQVGSWLHLNEVLKYADTHPLRISRQKPSTSIGSLRTYIVTLIRQGFVERHPEINGVYKWKSKQK